MGITRLNVYAGLAGGYIISDPDLALPTGLHAYGPSYAVPTPPATTVTPTLDVPTIPLIIQARMFDTNGQLYFPAGVPFTPNPDHPFWVPEFLGDTILVNGKAWPFMNVESKRYQFLCINGSNARTYEMFIAASTGIDSVVGINIELTAKGENKIYYLICVAKSLETVKKLNEEIMVRHPKVIIESTMDYWKAWVNVQNFSFYKLEPEIIELFKKSLFYIRAHVARNGAIIASGDSEMLQFGRDYYRYVWPRDSSVAAIALEKAGDLNASKRFIEFCNDTITDEAVFMHKYTPDKSIGSSWHPWVSGRKKQYPIQEDETALVICALWKYYEFQKIWNLLR